jgi:hypothetical protein
LRFFFADLRLRVRCVRAEKASSRKVAKAQRLAKPN